MVHVKDIADKKDPYAAAEELAREQENIQNQSKSIKTTY